MKIYRNEWKYVLRAAELSAIEARLKEVLATDENSNTSGFYEIHSLYFDDLFDSSVRENDAGISERFKYRIRYYGDDTDYIKLERKEKRNGMCHKDACKLTREEYEALVNGDVSEFVYDSERKLLQTFSKDILSKGYTPKAIVDYERVAFVEPISNVRITIDRNISASAAYDEFLTGDYLRYPVQEKLRHVLEVKFDDILPSYIRGMIDECNLVQTSFSKYYLGRKQLKNMERY